MERSCKFLQINLQHSKAASDVLNRTFHNDNVDIVLVQEPYVYGGLVRRLATVGGKLIYSREAGKPRAAMLLKSHIKSLPLPQFICRDLVAVQVVVPTIGGVQEIVVASAYLPGDTEEVPPIEVGNLIDYCSQNNKGLILGSDANAHHIVWGSTDVNGRGESLFEFICKTNLEIVNKGGEPTFVTRVRQEVLDITLATPSLSTKITNWHVSREASLSDHRHIVFGLRTEKEPEDIIRIPKLTDWNLYKEHLRSGLTEIDGGVTNIEDLNRTSLELHNAIHRAYELSCPTKVKRTTSKTTWWNQDLEDLRTSTRKLFNKAKRTRKQEHWDLYRVALTNYNKELRRAKRKSWRSFCDSINDLPAAARLQRVLSKEHSNQIGHLRKADGTFTESAGEMLELLLSTHFPGASAIPAKDDKEGEEIPMLRTPKPGSIKLAKRIFTRGRVEWALTSFKPYKAPGGDGIFPALLQTGTTELVPLICNLYQGSLSLGYIPKLWREARVVFIPKGGGRSEAQPKSYRPISLTSFLLKGMEKVLDQYLRNEVLSNTPLHRNQHAYQKAKSTITALHSLVLCLEKTLDAKEVALCAFMDIEGAFDNTSFESIEEAANEKGFHPAITSWIKAMLSCRSIKASMAGESAAVRAGRGCPQGGVLSPLLWSIVVDNLLNELTDSGIMVQGYADDLVIIVRGHFESLISLKMQRALNITLGWCQRQGLRINPEKTVLVPFTRKRKLNLSAPMLNGSKLDFKKEVKYLGVIIDQKLTWNSHLGKTRNKAMFAMQTCRRLLGRNWGLKPKMIHWSYKAIIRPMVTYASLVWWPKTMQKTAQAQLQKIQRLACLSITGAMSTCPTAALETLLDLLPLHLQVQIEAASSAISIGRNYKYKLSDLTGHLSILKTSNSDWIIQYPTDRMSVKYNFEPKYKVNLTNREEWKSGGPQFKRGSLQWFTDGSKKEKGSTGAGIKGPNCLISVPMGHNSTIFQAEVFALNLCALINLEKGMKGVTIDIITDSEAALKALSAYTCESALVWECLNNLNLLAKGNHVTLWWVPAHNGIKGNEEADSLAKKGADLSLTGPEPCCGAAKHHAKAHIHKWEEELKASHWMGTSGQYHAKKFISFSPRRAKEILALEKKDLNILTCLYTGHCRLKYHLLKIGKEEDDACRLCNESAETAEHILCTCPAASRLRLATLGQAFMTPAEVREVKPSQVIKFFKDLNLTNA